MESRFLRPKNKRKRKIRYQKRLKPVTVCIAAICDSIEGFLPKIVFCADRLTSVGIQYESGESKIKKLTEYCYAMSSSNDSLTSDLILEKVKDRIKNEKDIIKIEKIVEILSQECENFKDERIKKDVLHKYNSALENMKADPNTTIKDAVEEIHNYEYPLECEFIILGLELPRKAHIYKVNQDGNFQLFDSNGFATTGSGGSLAFLEMSKYVYARRISMTDALQRAYFSKKVSERAEGVGRYTDLYVLYFTEDPNTKKPTPAIFGFSNKEFIEKLDGVFNKIKNYEMGELAKLSKEIYEMLTKKPKDLEK